MSPAGSLNEDIQQHYARSDLGTAILAALVDAGKDVNHLKPEDLAPVDEFHIRGRKATLERARAVGLDTTKQVLDVGSGVGGPSRCIAREFGCRFTGIDLTDEYCRVATMLAEGVALSHLVSYRRGDALNLPFPDENFDVVWTQHVAMNIPDKATMYREVHRVLKPGGVLAIYDILAGPAGQVLFPVPVGTPSRDELPCHPGPAPPASQGNRLRDLELGRHHGCGRRMVCKSGQEHPAERPSAAWLSRALGTRFPGHGPEPEAKP